MAENVQVKISFENDGRGIVEAQKQLNDFARTIERGFKLDIGAQLGEWFTELPAKLDELVQKGVEYGETIRNMALQTRTTGTAFQVLGVLADEAGIDVSKFSAVTQQMSLHAGEAVNGNAALADAFSRLGLNAAEFSALPVPRQLEAIAQAAERAHWSTSALNDLSAILGTKNLPQLLPVLHELATEGFDELAKKAAEAGQIVGDQTVQALAKLGEQQKATSRNWSVFSADLAAAIQPGLDMLEKLSQGVAHTMDQALRATSDPAFMFTPGGVARTSIKSDEAFPGQHAPAVDVGQGSGAVAPSTEAAARAAQADEKKAIDQWNREMARDIDEAIKMANKAKEDAAKALTEQEKGDSQYEHGMYEDEIAGEKMVQQQQLEQLQAKGITLQEQALELEKRRSAVDQDSTATAVQKQTQISGLAEEYRKTLAQIIALKMQEEKYSDSPKEIAELEAEISRLKAQAAEFGSKPKEHVRTRESQSADNFANSADPSKHFSSAGSGMTAGLQDFAASIGTIGDQVHSHAMSIAQSLTGSIGGALTQLELRSQTFGQAWRAISKTIVTDLLQAGNQMVVNWLIQTAATTLIHTQGEAAKTAASASGSAMRGGIATGETLFHIIQDGIKLGSHIMMEIGKTVITITQVPLRIIAIMTETMANIANAAAGGMSAMASIPYVGPFLALAAMATILGAGAALVKSASKGFKSGGYTGNGDSNEEAGVVHRREFVNTADTVSHYGLGFFEALHRGDSMAAISQLHSKVVGSMGSRAGATRSTATEARAAEQGRALSVMFLDDRQQALRAMRTTPGRKQVVDMVWQNRGAFFAV